MINLNRTIIIIIIIIMKYELLFKMKKLKIKKLY